MFLGISSGASLGATIGVLFGFGALFGANSVGVMAFLGAMGTSFLVLFIANIGGRSNAGKLILAGMAVSSVCSAIGNFAIYIVNNKNATSEIMFWTMGSLAGAKWQRVGVLLPVVFIGTLIFWSQFRNLNLMLLGDEASITLGTDLHRARNLYMILSSLMVGFAVLCGGNHRFRGPDRAPCGADDFRNGPQKTGAPLRSGGSYFPHLGGCRLSCHPEKF